MPTATDAGPPGGLRYRSARGRVVLLATVLASGMAFLDATVVNIALPSIGEDLDATFAQLQWTVNAYALTLAALILIGGSLGDHLGRRRVFVWGVIWFAIASLLCAVAPSVEALIAARAVQGVGAALLTPGSLAILEATFHPDDRGSAIGAWSGLAGISTAIGPFLGGWLVEAASWRLIFLINLPLAAVVIWAARSIPETSNPEVRGQRLDLAGAGLTVVGLAGVTYALTEGDAAGWTDPTVVVLGVLGVVALAAFVAVEARGSHVMVPLDIFKNRLFSAANAVTFVVYAALAGALFLLPIQLQQVVGYSPIQAGSALIPLTVVMLALSSRAGRLAQRIGPRLLMGFGPIIAGVGLAMLTRVGPDASYVADVLPAVLVFGLGLSATVAPLNVTVLSAAGEERAGIASAINNAVARVAGLLAVAIIPLAAGLSGDDYRVPEAFDEGFQNGVIICAVACAAGGVLALATIRNPEGPARAPSPVHHCINGPPPRVPERAPTAVS